MTNIYAAPAPLGNNANSGLSAGAPKTLSGASALSAPGDTIYLLGGTYALSSGFYPAHNGTAVNWITYRNYNDTEVIFNWTGGNSSDGMIHVWISYVSPSTIAARYMEFRNITFEGNNRIAVGVLISNCSHVRISGCKIRNCGAAGIATKFADYIAANANQIYHCGYLQGWSSGISYNSHQWTDVAPGCHSYVLNNIISGTFDGSVNHTDGNGIIMDLSNNTYDPTTANTPPVLIANNVVYQNGGAGIICYITSNIWIVNNNIYISGLDLSLVPPSTRGTALNFHYAKDCYAINNIAYGWNTRYAIARTLSPIPGAFLSYHKNMWYGGAGVNFSNSELIHADPLFFDPPPVNPTAGGQYATALAPWNLANKLILQEGSPAIDAGINPSLLAGIPAEIAADLALYVGVDILGVSRPTGTAYDLGAYEFVPVSGGGGTPPFGLDQWAFEPTGYDGFTNADKMRMLSIEGFDGAVGAGTSEAMAEVIFQSLVRVTASPSLAALARVEFSSSAIVSRPPGEVHALFPKS